MGRNIKMGGKENEGVSALQEEWEEREEEGGVVGEQERESREEREKNKK